MKKNSTPPLSLYGQLLWREFFYTTATNNPCFDKMEGNPVCLQIPWDRNPEALAKWAEGQTGYPWIDAIMTQLRQEGWIHHLARHAVACFLTRGDLWISWEEGMKVRIMRRSKNPLPAWNLHVVIVGINAIFWRFYDAGGPFVFKGEIEVYSTCR